MFTWLCQQWYNFSRSIFRCAEWSKYEHSAKVVCRIRDWKSFFSEDYKINQGTWQGQASEKFTIIFPVFQLYVKLIFCPNSQRADLKFSVILAEIRVFCSSKGFLKVPNRGQLNIFICRGGKWRKFYLYVSFCVGMVVV